MLREWLRRKDEGCGQDKGPEKQKQRASNTGKDHLRAMWSYMLLHWKAGLCREQDFRKRKVLSSENLSLAMHLLLQAVLLVQKAVVLPCGCLKHLPEFWEARRNHESHDSCLNGQLIFFFPLET